MPLRVPRVALLCCLAGLGPACAGAPHPAQVEPALRMAGPEPALAIATALTRRHVPVRVTDRVPTSPLSAVPAITGGTADLGVAFADAVYTAHTVNGERSALRAIASLPATPVFLLVHPRAGIARVTDLRDHAVRLTSPGLGGIDPRFRLPFRPGDGVPAEDAPPVSSLSELIVRAFGLRPDDLRVQDLQPPEGLAALRAGTLDAYFTASGDDAPVREATAWGARLVPIDGPPVDALRQRYPFIQPVRIAPGIFTGQTSLLRTVGIGLVLVCRADLAPDVVYRVTRALTEELESGGGPAGPLAGLHLDRAPVTPIPLHPGAARFYREWELFR